MERDSLACASLRAFCFPPCSLPRLSFRFALRFSLRFALRSFRSAPRPALRSASRSLLPWVFPAGWLLPLIFCLSVAPVGRLGTMALVVGPDYSHGGRPWAMSWVAGVRLVRVLPVLLRFPLCFLLSLCYRSQFFWWRPRKHFFVRTHLPASILIQHLPSRFDIRVGSRMGPVQSVGPCVAVHLAINLRQVDTS